MAANKINSNDSPRNGPLSASGWNHVVESANDYHGRRALGEPSGPGQSRRGWHTVIKLQNDCAVNLRRGEVQELNGFALANAALDNDNLWFKGVDPDLTHEGWAIMREPIPYNAASPQVGDAVVYGICLAYVQFPDDTHSQKWAERKEGQRVLYAAESGPAKILHVGSAGDAEWEYLCLVQIMDELGPPIIQFTTTQYMSQLGAGGADATVNWSTAGEPPTDPVRVSDVNGQFPDIHYGAVGTAVYDAEEDEYRIISCQRVARRARATINGSLCPDADPAPTTISISGFEVQPVGDHVGDPPTIPLTANVGTIKAGMNGDSVVLERIDDNLPDPTWEIIAIAKHKLDVVVDVEDAGTELKQTKRKVWVEMCDETETDETIAPIDDCEEE